jgi:glucose/arabinose dehydrogenase
MDPREAGYASRIVHRIIHATRLLAMRSIVVTLMVAFITQGCSQPAPDLLTDRVIDVNSPLVFDTYSPDPCSPNGQRHGVCDEVELHRIRVVPVAHGLTNPWHLAFLPDGGGLLVSESTGRLGLIRNGSLEVQPISGWPDPVLEARTLNSVLVHPQFAQNGFVYLAYMKGREDGMTSVGLARGYFSDTTLSDVSEVFVADAWVRGGPVVSRAAFGPDGMIYLTVNDHDALNDTSDASVRMLAQDLGSDVGKVLRLQDDGAIPADNPFVDTPDANPQVYTYGHRNPTGLAWHPDTGELWETEIGPMGGDELNVLRAGRNYGWPLVSLGKIYNNTPVSEQSWWRLGMEMPVMHWSPSISPSGLTFYTGNQFPWWQGHVFLGALNGQMLQRVAFDHPPPQSERREALLTQLDRRVRHVVEGPDGYLYVATDTREPARPGQDGNGIVFRIEAIENGNNFPETADHDKAQ